MGKVLVNTVINGLLLITSPSLKERRGQNQTSIPAFAPPAWLHQRPCPLDEPVLSPYFEGTAHVRSQSSFFLVAAEGSNKKKETFF